MKTIILAAGYATRLYPLTLSTPKPLIEIEGRSLVERLFPSLSGMADSENVFVVTNNKFHRHFVDWKNRLKEVFGKNSLRIINDGTEDEKTKLGAIGDINFVIEKENIDDDLLVIAGDNFFSRSFEKFIEFGKKKNAPVIAVYDVKDFEKVKKLSEIGTDNSGRIIFFEEKPALPKVTMTGIALYYYPRHTLPLIKQYIKEENNPDQPGRLIEWLYKKIPVFTWPISGVWFDVGTHESLKEVEEFLKHPL